MKAAHLFLLLTAALAPLPAPALAKGPAQRCAPVLQTYVRKADLPAGALALLPPMAERGGRFNVTDDIGPGEEHLPFARFISARLTGCTLSVRYEYGGYVHGFATAVLERRGGAWVLVRER